MIFYKLGQIVNQIEPIVSMVVETGAGIIANFPGGNCSRKDVPRKIFPNKDSRNNSLPENGH